MKKFLIATTILVSTAGFAAAEIKLTGTAGMGLQYNSEGDEATKILSFVTLTFDGSGESDGGLAFGFNTNYKVTNNGTVDNDDTTVFISGAFGKLSMGAVSEADEVAGLSDLGYDGLDVDDVAEALVGDELGDLIGVSLGHNVNYTYEAGAFKGSISGRLATSHTLTNTESYAVGAKYTFGDAYVGLGYGDHQWGAGNDDAQVVSVFAGGKFNDFKIAAMYSDGSIDEAGVSYSPSAYGFNVAYTMDALTLSLGYGNADLDGYSPDQESIGIGASYDLGGGAVLKGAIAQVESVGDENQGTKVGADAKETRADFGIVLSF